MVSSSRYKNSRNLRFKASILLLTSLVSAAADKGVPFKPSPASEYEAKANFDQVLIAVDACDTAEKTKTAFGKITPNRYSVLPILLVIENNRKSPLDMRNLRVTYRPRGGQEIESTPSSEVKYEGAGPSKPKLPGTTRYPIPLPSRKKNGPLWNDIIDERAFAAKMLAPGESASGFVYFLTEYHGGVTITISGLRDSVAQKDLFYTEIPLTHR